MHGADVFGIAPGLPARFQRGNAAGALASLRGEAEGLAIDATAPNGLGSLAVKDLTTTANNRSNIALNSTTSPLVNSGTSPKLILKQDGTYEWAPHNLVIRSETLGTGWTQDGVTVSSDATVAPDGTTTADKIIETTATQGHDIISTGFTVVEDGTYLIRARIKAAERTFAILYTDISGSTAIAINLTTGAVSDTTGSPLGQSVVADSNGFWDCSFSVVSSGAGSKKLAVYTSEDGVWANRSFAGDDTKGLYVWGAQVNRGPTATAYMPTTTAAVYGVPISYDQANSKYGILVEPAATNLQIRSQELSDTAAGGWTENNITVADDAVVAPDGTTTAETLTESATDTVHNLYDGIILAGNTDGAFSIFAKAGTSSFPFIAYSTGSAEYHASAVFDLSDTTATEASETDVGTTSGTVTSTKQERLGNTDWYRLTLVAQTSQADGFFVVGFAEAATGNTWSNQGSPTYLGTGKTLHLWQADAIAGTTEQSPIPTYASTVTRAADDINILTSKYPHSETVGSIVWSGLMRTTAGNMWGVGNSNSIRITTQQVGGDSTLVVDDTTRQALLEPASNQAVALNTAFVDGAAWAANDFAHVKDGGSVGTDTSGTIPSSLATFRLGNVVAGSPISGWCYSLTYVPRRMTNAELQAKTT